MLIKRNETKRSHCRRIILPYPKLEGRSVCRWCRGPVPKGRRCWCSERCVNEYRERNDPVYMRRLVWKRDQGICQLCGLDVQALKDHLWNLRALGQAVFGEFWAVYRSKGFTSWSNDGDLWQADHIHEVAAGGAELGIQNLQVACTVCHKQKTRAFAAARARARQLSKQPELLVTV